MVSGARVRKRCSVGGAALQLFRKSAANRLPSLSQKQSKPMTHNSTTCEAKPQRRTVALHVAGTQGDAIVKCLMRRCQGKRGCICPPTELKRGREARRR